MSGRNYPTWRKEEQAMEALRLYMSGASYKVIAANLKIGVGTVYARIEQAMDSMRPHADYNEYRARQLAEMEVSRRMLNSQIVTWRPGTDAHQAHRALELLLRLQDREAKLLGLDRVPTPFDELADLSDSKLEEIVAQFAAQLAEGS